MTFDTRMCKGAVRRGILSFQDNGLVEENWQLSFRNRPAHARMPGQKGEDLDENPPPEPETDDEVRAFLEGLTGPSRDTIFWLSRDELLAIVGPDRHLHFVRPTEGKADGIARLKWTGDAYQIEALQENDQIWVNGRAVGQADLRHGDMIEFGNSGPMTRYRRCDHAFPGHWPVDEILGDAVAYVRTSRRSLGPRLSGAVGQSARRLVVQTTVFFRLTVVAVLLLMAWLGYALYSSDRAFEAALRQESQRLEAIGAALSQSQQEAVTARDLNLLREELALQRAQDRARLLALEERPEAFARIIDDAAPAVAFLQGAFGLRQTASGELLRHVLDAEGNRLRTPFGQPMLDPDGNGPPAEFQFTGTGFLLAGGRYLVTNRHIALPWTIEARKDMFEAGALSPELLRLIAYFPDRKVPAETRLVAVSDLADLAVLEITPAIDDGRGLTLADVAPGPGIEVIVIGFPTGLRALLAQSGAAFLDALKKEEAPDFWRVAALLSEQELIVPLVSRGIVAQSRSGALVYDAETATGGSGGPVMTKDGHVVAVNRAVLEDFTGSNIGVPVHALHELLDGLIPGE